MVWCNLCRDLFIENLEVKINDFDRISVFGDYREMSDFINRYDEIVELFARIASLILSGKWKLYKESLDWRTDTKRIINDTYKYVSE